MPVCTKCLHSAEFDQELNECKRTDCGAKQWYDNSMVCQENHQGCKISEHKIGTCLEAEEGYYVRKVDKVAELCSTRIDHCTGCHREEVKDSPSCSKCDGDLQTHFSDTVCECQKREYFSEDLKCQKNPEKCA